MTAETIAALCTRHPLALPVLHDLGIEIDDPEATVEAACAASAVPPATLVGAIVAAEGEVAARLCAPDDAMSVAALVDRVVQMFHRPFAHEIAVVTAACEAARRRANHPAWSCLLGELAELEADLSQHIAMEERVVFPWLRHPTSAATQPIRGLQLEHADAIVHLLAIDVRARQCLALDPSDARARAAVATLRQFERWSCEHLHVEGNTLFPLALRAELARR